MAQSPRPIHCLIVINLLESHYLGKPITDDCEPKAVRNIKKEGYIFQTSEVIRCIYSFSCKKINMALQVLYKPFIVVLVHTANNYVNDNASGSATVTCSQC